MKINNGEIVRVNKGSVVESYNPSKRKYTLKRSQKVKVNHQYEYPGRENVVVWAGTGGYWCWTNESNVQKIEVK